MHFRCDQPQYLWLLLLAVPMAWLGWRNLTTLEPARRWTALALRLVVLVLLVLTLAGLQWVRRYTDLTVVAVVDHSESVRQFFHPAAEPKADAPAGGGAGAQGASVSIDRWARQFLQQHQEGRRPDDRLGMLTYDGRPSVQALPALGADLDDAGASAAQEGTDTAAAIRLGMAMFPADSGKRMVLFWDGNDTSDDNGAAVLAAAREARAAGVPIDVVPLQYQLQHEVMIESVMSPAQVQRGQTASVRVVLSSTAPAEGTLYLRCDDRPVDLAPGPGSSQRGAPIHVRDWVLQESDTPPVTPTGAQGEAATPLNNRGAAPTGRRYLCVRLIEVPMVDAGIARLEAVFEPQVAPHPPAPGQATAAAQGSGGNGVVPAASDEPASPYDAIAINNRAESFTLVHGKGKVLLVDNVGGESGRVLAEALRRRGIDLEIIPDTAFPADWVALLRYDAVILQNVPAEALTPAQNRMLARYVNDLGGGLVMIGGPDSFGAGGWTNSPVDRVLPVECQVPNETVLPSGALVIVMDRSGSMGGDQAGVQKMEIANEAAVQAVATLYPQDLIGVVAFDTQTNWIVGDVRRLMENTDPQRIAASIRSIQPGGGTDIYPGLEQAYLALAPLGPEQAAIKHVILLTDGQSADGPYFQILGKMAKAGISLSTVAVGDDANNQLLQQLAQMGGGTFYPVQDPKKLPQIFIKEARTIRRNLIKEVPFTPTILRTGSPVTTGMSGTPALNGLVLTGPKHDPRVYLTMTGPDGEPLFAHWQVGLGRCAAFTSDATNRWATPWMSWPGYIDFWARTVRLVSRPAASRLYDLTTTAQKDRLHLRLDATGADDKVGGGEGTGPGAAAGDASGGGGFANFLQVAGTVLTPDGQATAVKLEQTGPGLYEADVPAAATGNYVVSLVAQGIGGAGGANSAANQPQTIFGGVNKPIGAELRVFRSNAALVRQVAEMTGGQVLDPAAARDVRIFDRVGVTESRAMRPLWRVLVYWLLALFLLDVAVRRLAWDVASIRHWLMQRGDAMLGLLKPREAAGETTLAALKRKVRQVETRLGTAGPAEAATGSAAAATTSAATATPPDRSYHYEAAEGESAAEDWASSLGGADSREDVPSTVLPGQPAGKDQGPTTSRLLDAKRRARQHMDDAT